MMFKFRSALVVCFIASLIPMTIWANGFGEFFSAVTFKPDSSACEEGSFQLVVSREWGEELSWSSGECLPVRCDYVDGTGACAWGDPINGLFPTVALDSDAFGASDDYFIESPTDRFSTSFSDGEYSLSCFAETQSTPYGAFAEDYFDGAFIKGGCTLYSLFIYSEAETIAAGEGMEAALESGLLEGNPIVIQRIPSTNKKGNRGRNKD